ncbi:OLC1v1035635C1 [Oldenlandia corymbosa var. corymbosa]|uniref:OLC1v1035635C1 n=1 Tax=Oldenlandia corymbosa var. corymbosa TaxID=529605 RepID=A0AAV1CVZ8_OLDCO|nr:OLC1v1035635C1 [Oldenlandia corymbosa var. corymbosa]
MYELQFAVPMSGAVLNNINTRLAARTISVILQHSESKLVFVDFYLKSLFLEAISGLPKGLSTTPMLILISPESDDAADRNSGSSGPMAALMILMRPVYLWMVPMFHTNGWSYSWGMSAVGGTNICLRRFDAGVIFKLIGLHNVTHMCGTSIVLNMLANSPLAKPLKNPVHFMTSGTPPLATVILRTESLGFVVSRGYGLTEVAGVVVSCAWKPEWNSLPASDQAKLKARQGVRTLGLMEVNVVEPETGLGVKRDGSTMGEIVGGSVMLGYLKNPKATSKCMINGWFYTGDVGVMHPDGYLEIKDRSKDIIISGGENVSSMEVESVLYMNPAVNEAAAVARPDDYWGETPCAFVSLKEKGLTGRPTERDIIEFCRARLPHYTVPKTVVFMEELPKTATGKIEKLSLRNIASKLGFKDGCS